MLKWSSGGDRSCGSGASIEYRLRYSADLFSIRDLGLPQVLAGLSPTLIRVYPMRSEVHVIKRGKMFNLVKDLKGAVNIMVLIINVDSKVVEQNIQLNL